MVKENGYFIWKKRGRALDLPLSLLPRPIDFQKQLRHERRLENTEPMTVIIRNGKPQVSDSLCNTCYWAHIQRGFAESEEVILCAFLRQPHAVPFKVSYCTDYNDKRVPSKADMEEIAWIIRTKSVNRQVGFASETEPQEDEVEIVPSE